MLYHSFFGTFYEFFYLQTYVFFIIMITLFAKAKRVKSKQPSGQAFLKPVFLLQ